MQCMNCHNKKINGISPSRSRSRAPLTTNERSDICHYKGFCRSEKCCTVHNRVLAWPDMFKEQYDNLFDEYFKSIESYYDSSLSRAEFVVKRNFIKRQFQMLCLEVDSFRAQELAKEASQALEAKTVNIERRVFKRRRTSKEEQERTKSEAFSNDYAIQHLQKIAKSFLTRIRTCGANIQQAKEQWKNILHLPDPLFDSMYNNPMPYENMTLADFKAFIQGYSFPTPQV